MNCLSFDVGGTTVKYGVIDESYKILKKDKIPTPDNEEKFLYSLSSIIQENLSKISKVSIAMPGYGFAKVSKVARENLMTLIEEYIENRDTLDHVYLLIDSKVGIKNSDIDMLDLLSDCSRKFSIILTKIDKISNNYLEYQKKSILSLMQNYKKSFTKIYQSETKKNNGITEIQRSIYGLSQ